MPSIERKSAPQPVPKEMLKPPEKRKPGDPIELPEIVVTPKGNHVKQRPKLEI